MAARIITIMAAQKRNLDKPRRQRAFHSFFHPPSFAGLAESTCRIHFVRALRIQFSTILLFKKDVQYAFYVLSTIENPGRNHIWIQRNIWGK